MNKILWKLQVPPTGLIRGPIFKVLPKRQCEISFSIEAENGAEQWLSLSFQNVEVYKCTYLTSLGSVNRELRTEAYGQLIAIADSPWLREMEVHYREYYKKMPEKAHSLEHLMINFDDGPCYELICGSFEFSKIQGSSS